MIVQVCPDKTTEMFWIKKVWRDDHDPSLLSQLVSLHSLRSSILRFTLIYQRCVQHPHDAGLRSYYPSDQLLTFLSSITLEIFFLHLRYQLSSGESTGFEIFTWSSLSNCGKPGVWRIVWRKAALLPAGCMHVWLTATKARFDFRFGPIDFSKRYSCLKKEKGVCSSECLYKFQL